MRYIDLFAGCGGLSLGLLKAGWQGLFAIEKSPLAFETLQYNLISDHPDESLRFHWPDWLPQTSFDINQFLSQYECQLKDLRGQVSLVTGGPPCQGYSFAGRRNRDDERNHLVDKYLDVVDLVEPDMLLLENVRGITVAFSNGTSESSQEVQASESLLSAAEEIKKALIDKYYVFDKIIKALDFGVPQYRPRYIMIAIKRTLADASPLKPNPFTVIEILRNKFIQSQELPLRAMMLGEAISDLKRSHGVGVNEENPRFQHGRYGPMQGPYQRLLRVNKDGQPLGQDVVPDSHRFANHREATVIKFRRIMRRTRGKQLSPQDRVALGTGKHAITPLARTLPSHTLTTLPDDLIHYSEPRILTVRESARVQSFPDWFWFRGKYTTGAEVRKYEVPRYTQVGNAVPPLMAQGIGYGLAKYYNAIRGIDDDTILREALLIEEQSSKQNNINKQKIQIYQQSLPIEEVIDA